MNIKTIIWVLIGIAVVAGILAWTAKRDQAVMAWAEKYEECVKVEYRTTPWEWYADHGEYPKCDVTK